MKSNLPDHPPLPPFVNAPWDIRPWFADAKTNLIAYWIAWTISQVIWLGGNWLIAYGLLVLVGVSTDPVSVTMAMSAMLFAVVGVLAALNPHPLITETEISSEIPGMIFWGFVIAALFLASWQ